MKQRNEKEIKQVIERWGKSGILYFLLGFLFFTISLVSVICAFLGGLGFFFDKEICASIAAFSFFIGAYCELEWNGARISALEDYVYFGHKGARDD